jgi:hypothetical protein
MRVVLQRPIDHAQRILSQLEEVDVGEAKIALRIAEALIDQRGRYEAAAALAAIQPEV